MRRVPLRCVHHAYSKKPDGHVVYLSSHPCLAAAPRDPARPDEPLHPNPHGDPLCPEHARSAQDPLAFPDGGHPDTPLLPPVGRRPKTRCELCGRRARSLKHGRCRYHTRQRELAVARLLATPKRRCVRVAERLCRGRYLWPIEHLQARGRLPNIKAGGVCSRALARYASTDLVARSARCGGIGLTRCRPRFPPSSVVLLTNMRSAPSEAVAL